MQGAVAERGQLIDDQVRLWIEPGRGTTVVSDACQLEQKPRAKRGNLVRHRVTRQPHVPQTRSSQYGIEPNGTRCVVEATCQGAFDNAGEAVGQASDDQAASGVLQQVGGIGRDGQGCLGTRTVAGSPQACGEPIGSGVEVVRNEQPDNAGWCAGFATQGEIRTQLKGVAMVYRSVVRLGPAMYVDELGGEFRRTASQEVQGCDLPAWNPELRVRIQSAQECHERGVSLAIEHEHAMPEA